MRHSELDFDIGAGYTMTDCSVSAHIREKKWNSMLEGYPYNTHNLGINENGYALHFGIKYGFLDYLYICAHVKYVNMSGNFISIEPMTWGTYRNYQQTVDGNINFTNIQYSYGIGVRLDYLFHVL